MAKLSRKGRGTNTIDDVARAAGVSAMTVSRVINGSRNVRDTTRVVVLDAIGKLGFSPNIAARNLAAGKATHFGLLYANPSAAYLSQFLIGALEAARRAGCHLVIEACESENADEQTEVTRLFATSEVKGVILPPPLSESHAIMNELNAIGIPVVTVAKGNPLPGGFNVRIDDFSAAREMTDHLHALGHRRMGFIKGHPNHMASHERYSGFKAALEAHGLNGEEAPAEQGYFTYRSGLSATERLLERADPPTAIFASNDDMASAAISVAHRRGLLVPGDLSIVGFDDTSLATTVWPELTTVKQPIAAMAEAALEMLLAGPPKRRSGADGRSAERVLGHSLVLRGSSGPPVSAQG